MQCEATVYDDRKMCARNMKMESKAKVPYSVKCEKGKVVRVESRVYSGKCESLNLKV